MLTTRSSFVPRAHHRECSVRAPACHRRVLTCLDVLESFVSHDCGVGRGSQAACAVSGSSDFAVEAGGSLWTCRAELVWCAVGTRYRTLCSESRVVLVVGVSVGCGCGCGVDCRSEAAVCRINFREAPCTDQAIATPTPRREFSALASIIHVHLLQGKHRVTPDFRPLPSLLRVGDCGLEPQTG